MAQRVTEIEDRGNQAELREERLLEEIALLAQSLPAPRRASKVETRPSSASGMRRNVLSLIINSASKRRDEISALRRQIEELQQAHEAAMNTLRERLDESAQRNAAAKALEADLKGACAAPRKAEQAVDQIERQAQEHRQQIAEYRSDLERGSDTLRASKKTWAARWDDQRARQHGRGGLRPRWSRLKLRLTIGKSVALRWRAKPRLLADVERLRGQLDGQGDELARAEHQREQSKP